MIPDSKPGPPICWKPPFEVVSTAPAIPHAALERAASELASLLGGAELSRVAEQFCFGRFRKGVSGLQYGRV